MIVCWKDKIIFGIISDYIFVFWDVFFIVVELSGVKGFENLDGFFMLFILLGKVDE